MADEWYSKTFDNKHEAVNEFIQYKQSTGRSDRTLNEYSLVLRKFYHEQFPDLSPGDTGIDEIERWVRKMDNRDLSRNTKRRYLETLSAFFEYAVKRPQHDSVTSNPAGLILEEIPRVVRDRPDCATWENAKQIVHAVSDPRNKSIAVLLAKTGCRVSEALAIELNDLMLDEGFIRLRNRKGGKETVVPIDDEVKKAIQRLRIVRPSTDSDYLFLSMRGSRISRERVRIAVRDAAVQCGIMEEGETEFHRKFTPHTFRTVFTTLMRRQGMDNRVLQYIRGDSNAQTMDVYTRIHREKAHDQYSKCMKNYIYDGVYGNSVTVPEVLRRSRTRTTN